MNRDRDTFDMFKTRDRGRFGDAETVRGNDDVRSDLVDLSVVMHHETPARGAHNQGAVLVSNDGNEARAVWIPKSLCEVENLNRPVACRRSDGSAAKGQAVTITLSQRFAKEKGLL